MDRLEQFAGLLRSAFAQRIAFEQDSLGRVPASTVRSVLNCRQCHLSWSAYEASSAVSLRSLADLPLAMVETILQHPCFNGRRPDAPQAAGNRRTKQTLAKALDPVTAQVWVDMLEDPSTLRARELQRRRGVLWEAGAMPLLDSAVVGALASSRKHERTTYKFIGPNAHIIKAPQNKDLLAYLPAQMPDSQDATAILAYLDQGRRQWRTTLLEAAYLRWAKPETIAILTQRLHHRFAYVHTHPRASSPDPDKSIEVIHNVAVRQVPCFERAALLDAMDFAGLPADDVTEHKYLATPVYAWRFPGDSRLNEAIVWSTPPLLPGGLPLEKASA